MSDQTETTQQVRKNNKSAKRDYLFAMGRRKSAVARVRLYKTV